MQPRGHRHERRQACEHFTTLTSVHAAVCLVPLRYDAGVYEFGTVDGDFIGSALQPGEGSIGTRSEAAAGVLAASISFDKGLLFGCGTLASQSSGHACHVYVAPAVEAGRRRQRSSFFPQRASTVLYPSRSAAL